MTSSLVENMGAEFLRRWWAMTPLTENAYPVLIPDLDPYV